MLQHMPRVTVGDEDTVGGSTMLEIKGWLWKKNQRLGWVKRYVVLNTQWLAYYEKPEHEFPLGFLNSQDILLVQPSQKNATRRFDVVTDAHVYQLLAATPKILKKWMDTMEKIILHSKNVKTEVKKNVRSRGTPKFIKEFWHATPGEQESKNLMKLHFSHSLCALSEKCFKAVKSNKKLFQKLLLHCSDDRRLLSLLLDILLSKAPEIDTKAMEISRQSRSERSRKISATSKTELTDRDRSSTITRPRRFKSTSIRRVPRSNVLVTHRRSVSMEMSPDAADTKGYNEGKMSPRASAHGWKSPRSWTKPRGHSRSSSYTDLFRLSDAEEAEAKSPQGKPFRIVLGGMEDKLTAPIQKFTLGEQKILYTWLIDPAGESIESILPGLEAKSALVRGLCLRIIFLVISQMKFKGVTNNNKKLAREFARIIARNGDRKSREEGQTLPIKVLLEDHATLSTMLLNQTFDWNDMKDISSYFHPSSTIVSNSSIWLAMFSNMNGSHIYPRLKYLKDVMYFLINRKQNSDTLLKIDKWQAWLLPLLFDIPATEKQDSSHTILGRVRTYALGILTVVHWQAANEPGRDGLLEFARQLRTSLTLMNATCSQHSCELSCQMLLALIARFHSDRKHLVVRSTQNTDKNYLNAVKETVLHKWQCLLHLVRTILMFVLMAPPSSFNIEVSVSDKVNKAINDQKRRSSTRTKSHSALRASPKKSKPQIEDNSPATSELSFIEEHLKFLMSPRDWKKARERRIPIDRIMLHTFQVNLHFQSEQHGLTKSWSELTASSIDLKSQMIHDHSASLNMSAEAILDVYANRLNEIKNADGFHGCGEGKLPSKKKGGRPIDLEYYGIGWKKNLPMYIDLLTRLQSLIYTLKENANENHLKSTAIKRVMDQVIAHGVFVSDAIVFLRLSHNLWRLLKHKKMKSLVRNFCRAPDTHMRRKTFHNSQKEKTKEDLEASKLLEKVFEEEKKSSSTYEILLLGPGQSGKSTIFKQLVHLHGEGFSENERHKLRPTAYVNIIGALRNLIFHAERAANREDESVNFTDVEVIKQVMNAMKGEDAKSTVGKLKKYVEGIQEIEKLEEKYRNVLVRAAKKKEELPKAIEYRKKLDKMNIDIKESMELAKKHIDQFFKQFLIPKSFENAVAEIESQSLSENQIVMNPQLHKAITELWDCKAIQAIYRHRTGFRIQQVDDSCQYFLKQLPRILPDARLTGQYYMDNYLPSLDDVLNMRKRTKGVVQGTFAVQTSSGAQTFKVVDVAGQRGARRRWIPLFNQCDAILFVVSLAGYNRYLVEQSSTFRLTEAINVFNDTISQASLRNTPFIVFLNKIDLFEIELETIPLTKCFPQYQRNEDFAKGSLEDVREAVRFVRNQFMKNVTDTHKNDFYFHTTCATDTNQVEKIFSSVTDIIINRGLAAAGLI
eukprot:CAMPEP_0167752972 /NCGR_PEP_ID=MMETSP0110_2-20121227/7443_1 /TAXON_ID=629695 /ORGANISM="Gymnochlora sp., Strain CCMP2014" /LENGTH=1411 /DNA_ID=CAMNT_0007638663 /DNA_START=46 /DNA_END=4281 /DNA_ORIENTATION=+